MTTFAQYHGVVRTLLGALLVVSGCSLQADLEQEVDGQTVLPPSADDVWVLDDNGDGDDNDNGDGDDDGDCACSIDDADTIALTEPFVSGENGTDWWPGDQETGQSFTVDSASRLVAVDYCFYECQGCVPTGLRIRENSAVGKILTADAAFTNTGEPCGWDGSTTFHRATLPEPLKLQVGATYVATMTGAFGAIARFDDPYAGGSIHDVFEGGRCNAQFDLVSRLLVSTCTP